MLHIGIDPETGQINTSELTKTEIGDPRALPDLLAQIGADVGKLLRGAGHLRRSGGHLFYLTSRSSSHHQRMLHPAKTLDELAISEASEKLVA